MRDARHRTRLAEESLFVAWRGERVHDSAPRNYGSHPSVIGAMGLRGLVATLTVEGAVDTLCNWAGAALVALYLCGAAGP